jgi:hypothetical protein
MRLAEGTTVWPFAAKKSVKVDRSESAVFGGVPMDRRAYRRVALRTG